MAWGLDLSETSLPLKYSGSYTGTDSAEKIAEGKWRIEKSRVSSRNALFVAAIPILCLAIWLISIANQVKSEQGSYGEIVFFPSFWGALISLIFIASYVLIIYLKNISQKHFDLSRSIDIDHEYLYVGSLEGISYHQNMIRDQKITRNGLLKASLACIEVSEIGSADDNKIYQKLLWEENLDSHAIKKGQSNIHAAWQINLPKHLPPSTIDGRHWITWQLRVKVVIPGHFSDTCIFVLPVTTPKNL